MDTVFPVAAGISSYQFRPSEYDPEAKESLTPYMSPILPACFAPSQSKENERRAVQGRVLDVKSEIFPTVLLMKFITEFIELVIPDVHVGHPVEVEEVFLKQCRPSQRVILQQAIDAGDDVNKTIKSFLKKEAYGAPKDPRIISTINSRDKLDYSTYIYSIAAAIKQHEWYAFGKTPLDIAARVATLCENARVSAINSDLSRFDGHVSPILRELESKLLLRYFAAEHAGEILKLHRSQYNQKGVTSKGVKYDTGYSRLSGSPETSVFNTVASAFIAYCAYRAQCDNGAYPTPQDAFERLGIFGGDDGLSTDIQPGSYIKSAKLVGQVLTTEEIKRGDFGITFLSRFYSDAVWHGDVNSICDIQRQMSKFHTTPNLPASVPATEKLLEKSRSYFLTDANTPIIGALVGKVLELAPEQKIDGEEDPLGIRTWCSRVPNVVQYPNEPGDWMQHYVVTQLESFDQDRFDAYLASSTSLSDILAAPICEEPKRPVVKNDAVVGGEYIAKEPARQGPKPALKRKSRKRKPAVPQKWKDGPRFPKRGLVGQPSG